MTTSSIASWMSCAAAAVGGTVFLTSAQPPSREQPGRPPVLHASIVPSVSDRSTATKSDSSARNPDLETLRQKVEMLERGRDHILKTSGYRTKFIKQEVVDGERLDEQVILMKCRHRPFSVYLAWQEGEAGREVLYVEGENDGRLLGHDGGWKSKLPSILLKPDSQLAMRGARYPVTDAGLAGLAGLMLKVHQHDLQSANVASCTVKQTQGPNGRSCHEFTTIYKDPQVSPTYRKSITRIDDEWNVPVETLHFGWTDSTFAASDAALDEATLIESYRFDEINFDDPPQDVEFDRNNPDYRF